ncbi:MAG: hypothetical protein JWN86_133 [Planctomycetota bacterium]|nr:hypothetical protein [Planctomycetota bacterium]
MKRFLLAMCVTVLLPGMGASVRADDAEAKAVLDKAIKALGGEEKLAKADKYTLKSKGTVSINNMEIEFTVKGTMQGLDHYRSEFEGTIDGNPIKVVSVLNGDKAWRRVGDNTMELDDEGLATEKRTVYVQAATSTLLPLKGKDFKLEKAADEKVDDKAAAVVKVTGPDGKPFTLFFDKESGLPVKMTTKTRGFMGEEVDQESVYSNYKEFDGIKRAAKVSIKRDGAKFLEQDITEFKVLDKLDADTFAEPQ